jgi:tetratricopeptide (TPR) repeat protein
VLTARRRHPLPIARAYERTQLEPVPAGDDTPEQVLRVTRGTSFEGLKAARRVALEAAAAPAGQDVDGRPADGGGAARVEKIEWAFDALIAQSRDFFTAAIASNPEDAQAHYNLGNFYQTLEKMEDAERCYRAAAKLDASHIDSMNNLAMILQARGEIDEAEAYYLRCVEVGFSRYRPPRHRHAL